MAYKSKRKLKVYQTGNDSRNPIPQIRLQGKWLKEIGFKPGDTIYIKCEEGRMIVSTEE